MEIREKNFLESLEDFVQASKIDSRDYVNGQRTQNLVRFGADPFGRDSNFSHITASAWIVNPDKSAIVLTHHRKLDQWLQIGGHCDGNTDPFAVAVREIEEETGLVGLKSLSKRCIDIDIHLIPESNHEKAHFHYDIRYLFQASDAIPLIQSIESNALSWVKFDQIEAFTNAHSVLIAKYKILESYL
jgi:8-oxo-dGTP pyrophosphatase MutT (NUDIX family)